MGKMDHHSLRDEAAECRRRALAYRGRPEADFLLRAAQEFEQLADANGPFQVRPTER